MWEDFTSSNNINGFPLLETKVKEANKKNITRKFGAS